MKMFAVTNEITENEHHTIGTVPNGVKATVDGR